MPKNIIAIPKTNSVNELVKIYNSADVFLNPTLEDNFPTTNLESLACGTPVITIDTGGSIESINDMTGIVINKNRFGDLKDAIEKSILNFSKEEIIKHSKKFSKEKMYIKYLDVYNRVIK